MSGVEWTLNTADVENSSFEQNTKLRDNARRDTWKRVCSRDSLSEKKSSNVKKQREIFDET